MTKYYYYEFFNLGNYVKVVALDPRTKLEISFSGAKGTSKKELMRLAGLKLSKFIESKYQQAIIQKQLEEQEQALKHKQWQNDNKNWLA